MEIIVRISSFCEVPLLFGVLAVGTLVNSEEKKALLGSSLHCLLEEAMLEALLGSG